MQTDKDQLETIIDDNGIVATLAFLAEICSEKADHIGTNYNDKTLEKMWARYSVQISALAERIRRQQ
jgi:hypothetical protein